MKPHRAIRKAARLRGAQPVEAQLPIEGATARMTVDVPGFTLDPDLQAALDEAEGVVYAVWMSRRFRLDPSPSAGGVSAAQAADLSRAKVVDLPQAKAAIGKVMPELIRARHLRP